MQPCFPFVSDDGQIKWTAGWIDFTIMIMCHDHRKMIMWDYLKVFKSRKQLLVNISYSNG